MRHANRYEILAARSATNEKILEGHAKAAPTVSIIPLSSEAEVTVQHGLFAPFERKTNQRNLVRCVTAFCSTKHMHTALHRAFR